MFSGPAAREMTNERLNSAAHHPGKDHVLSILCPINLNIRTVIERILPAQPCVLCGSKSHDGLWCADCDKVLPYLDTPRCPVCALATPGGEICGQCLKKPPMFTSTTAVFSYSFPLDKLVHAMKYGEQFSLAHAFAKKLAWRHDQTALPDYLIPMPLHPSKLRERGFNQSMLIAATVANELDIKILPDSCIRVRDTPPQSTLPWKERDRNMRKAFRCDVDLAGKHIALVDDVMTTGASLNALADAAYLRGAKKISAWVVARTLPRNH